MREKGGGSIDRIGGKQKLLQRETESEERKRREKRERDRKLETGRQRQMQRDSGREKKKEVKEMIGQREKPKKSSLSLLL